MELREIEVFLVLAEELHFGRTAARLHLTQGRVSQAIKALERQVGAALFERTSRKVRLTPLGERFLPGARDGRDQLVRALRDCQSLARGVSGQLRVGYQPSIGPELVNRVVAEFELRHPHCQVKITSTVHTQALLPVFSTDAPSPEVILTWAPGGDARLLRRPGLSAGPVLAECGRAVIVPTGHPLAALGSISVEDLAEHVLLNPSNTAPMEHRAAWTPLMTPAGRPIKQTDDDIYTLTGREDMLLDDVLQLVARGRGLHCTIETALERIPFRGLTAVPIRDLPPFVVVPLWRTDSEDALIRAFVEAAVAAVD